MKRRWNISLWVGFLLVLSAIPTYLAVFVRLPATRDFPWPTLLILSAGLLLVASGVWCAYRAPQLYRGKIAGPVLAVLSLGIAGLFAYGAFYVARQLPSSAAAPRVGQRAPDFTLPDSEGVPVHLAELLGSGTARGALLIFYRGDW